MLSRRRRVRGAKRPYPAPIQRLGDGGPGHPPFPIVQHALSYPWRHPPGRWERDCPRPWGILADANPDHPFPGRLVLAHQLRPRENVEFLVEMLAGHGFGGARIAALALAAALTYRLSSTSQPDPHATTFAHWVLAELAPVPPGGWLASAADAPATPRAVVQAFATAGYFEAVGLLRNMADSQRAVSHGWALRRFGAHFEIELGRQLLKVVEHHIYPDESSHQVAAGRRAPNEEDRTYAFRDDRVVGMCQPGSLGMRLELRHPIAGQGVFLMDAGFPSTGGDHVALWEDSGRRAALLLPFLNFLAGQWGFGPDSPAHILNRWAINNCLHDTIPCHFPELGLLHGIMLADVDPWSLARPNHLIRYGTLDEYRVSRGGPTDEPPPTIPDATETRTRALQLHRAFALPTLLNTYTRPVAEAIAERSAQLSENLNKFVVDAKRVHDDYVAIHRAIPDRIHELANEWTMLCHLGDIGVLEVLHAALLYAYHHQSERTKDRPYLLGILEMHDSSVPWLKEVVGRYRRRYRGVEEVELYVTEWLKIPRSNPLEANTAVNPVKTLP